MKRKKIVLIILYTILLIAAAITVVDLLYMSSVDKRFVRSANRGMLAGWEKSEPESSLRNINLKGDTTFIEEEYSAVAEFRKGKFRDEKLAAAAAEYIDALAECRKVIKKKDPAKGFNSFWKSFSEPYGRRLRVIYDLERGGFGFLSEVPEEYAGDKEELLLQGWALTKTSEIAFERADGDKENELTAKVVNDSGHALDYMELTVDLYDKEGNLAETVTVYKSDIKKDAKFVLHCYETEAGRTSEYVIRAINCEKAD